MVIGVVVVTGTIDWNSASRALSTVPETEPPATDRITDPIGPSFDADNRSSVLMYTF
jgi:hypothetical protein